MARCAADQQQRIALTFQREIDRAAGILDQPDAADHRGGPDRIAARLVVERHITRDDRVVESQTRLAHAFDRAGELAHDLGLFGIAEIHVVGQR